MKPALISSKPLRKVSSTLFLVLASIAIFTFVGGLIYSYSQFPQAILRAIFILLAAIVGLILVFWLLRKTALGAALIVLVVPFEQFATPVKIGPVSISLKLVTLVTLLVFVTLSTSIIVGKRKISKRILLALFIPLLILITSFISSVISSREPFVSLESWSYQLFLVAFLFLLPHSLRRLRDFEISFKAMAVASLVVSVYGMFQLVALRFSIPDPLVSRGFLKPLEDTYGIAKITSFQANPNPFAGYLVSTLFVILTVFLYQWRSNHKARFYLFCILIIFLTFLLTMSRSGMFGLICGSLALLTISRGGKKFGKLPWNSIISFAGLLLTLGAVSLFFTPQGQTIINQFLSRTTLAQSSTDYHLDFARGAFAMFRDRPILGWGVNQFKPVYLSDYSPYPWLVSANTHSMFLTILSETGIIGLFSHFLLIIYFALAIRKGLRAAGRGTFQFYILAGLTAGYVAILTGNIFYDYYFNEFVWVYFGLLLAVIQFALRQKAEAQQALSI